MRKISNETMGNIQGGFTYTTPECGINGCKKTFNAFYLELVSYLIAYTRATNAMNQHQQIDHYMNGNC